MYKRIGWVWGVVLFSVVPGATAQAAASGDFDGNGYVDPRDFRYFEICLSLSGPGEDPGFTECRSVFDSDGDRDIDLRDIAAFQRARGHLPFPLRDTFGDVIHVDSTVPYSGQKTCGANACHDIARITNGIKFQEGRTDAHGNIIMREDYYGDGRYWIRGGGRYGRSIPIGTDRILSPKQGAHESDMDLSTFGWIGGCSACHTGGGPGEFDRDGVRLYDPPTGRFGYEVLGKTAEDVALDGDYTDLDPATGNISLARWDITGLSEPDCLHCHTPDPRWKNLPSPYNRADYKRLEWRSATLAAKTNLVDNSGNHVPAFAAAGTAGQGWFSGSPPTTANPKLQIDYSVGVNLGTLAQAPNGVLNLVAQSVDRPPRDVVCWPCHDSSMRRRGDPWFDERIVHYARWNKLTDDDPSNDVPIYKSRGCNYCHPGNMDHNFAKGNNPGNVFRDELDWVNFRSCRNCHLTYLPNGLPNPLKHPDAPDVPGTAMAHLEGRMMDVMSCQACHIPYPLAGPGISTVQDGSVTGTSVAYPTNVFYSADPLNPSDPDKSRWYAGLDWKQDIDGVTRLFPFVQNQRLYWGDWDQKGTPDDRSDDIIAPIALWRFRQATGGNPLPGVTDDNGDGIKEINRDEEILAYITALKGVDRYGRQVAANPVYLKAFRVWYEDPQAPSGVSSFDPKEFGIKVEFGSGKGLSHGVQPKEFALGYNATNQELGCRDCHRPDTFDSPVFDRLILVDPWGSDGQPVYQKVREMTGLNPP